jgi:ribose 5-phosphate isomerase A
MRALSVTASQQPLRAFQYTLFRMTCLNPAQLKTEAARAALRYVKANAVLGVGSGSTVNAFIALLPTLPFKINAAVAASSASEALLKAQGIRIADLNSVERIGVYVDGADEIGPGLALIKGGGAALTREKIIAQAADQFVCIADASKVVPQLGKFPLPVEVIPMARAQVALALTQLGGMPVWREDVITDNGNHILDVRGLAITNPAALETTINQIPGVVTNGLFALRAADIAYIAHPDGIRTLHK